MRQRVEAAGDDFERAGIREEGDIRSRFADRFFFGAEGDDPLTPLAFRDDWHPTGTRLRAFFGSDIGHWDVRNFVDPLAEAYEHVETGRLAEDDFRDFVFSNAAFLYGSNPAFFRNTVVEDDVSRLET
jgi:hypothetical protein